MSLPLSQDLSSDLSLITAALSSSTRVELSADGAGVRRAGATAPPDLRQVRWAGASNPESQEEGVLPEE